MVEKTTLTRKRIFNGVYEGILIAPKNTTDIPELNLTYQGKVVGEVFADPIETIEGKWLIRCRIPADVISDGVQTFLINYPGDSKPLDNFTIIAGDVLDDDLRSEIDLLRQELDMLKRAFRRHCVETM